MVNAGVMQNNFSIVFGEVLSGLRLLAPSAVKWMVSAKPMGQYLVFLKLLPPSSIGANN
jgi:hypothetical protein